MTQAIQEKLDEIHDEITDLRVAYARQKQQEENHQVNIKRFWDLSWPKVLEKMDENTASIQMLNVQMAEMRTRAKIWGVTLTIVPPILMSLAQNLVWKN